MREELNSTIPDHTFDVTQLCRYFSELSPQPMLAVEGATCIVRHVNAAFLRLERRIGFEITKIQRLTRLAFNLLDDAEPFVDCLEEACIFRLRVFGLLDQLVLAD